MVFGAPRMLIARTVIVVAILATLETALLNVITKVCTKSYTYDWPTTSM